MSTGPVIEPSRNDELSAQLNILNGKGQGKRLDQNEIIEDSEEESAEHRDIATSEEFLNSIEIAYRSDKDLRYKILYTTLSKIRYYTFKDEVNEQSAEDVIQNVILLIAQGIRKWNKVKFPNVVNFLLMIIHSYVRNESKKKQKWKNEDIYDAAGKLKENKVEKFCREALTEDLSEELFKEKLENLINTLEVKLIEKCDDDAYYVLDEILKYDLEELDDNSLSKKLGITAAEFKLAKRRIRYAANQIIKK